MVKRELWQRERVIEKIRSAAIHGLVFTAKPDNFHIVEQFYQSELAVSVKQKKPSSMFPYSVDAMAAKDYIQEHGRESYLKLQGGEITTALSKYFIKYYKPLLSRYKSNKSNWL